MYVWIVCTNSRRTARLQRAPVCISECVCESALVYMHTYAPTHTHRRSNKRSVRWGHLCQYICMCASLCINTYFTCKHAPTCTYTYTHKMHTCARTYACMHACTQAHLHAPVHTHTRVHTHTYRGVDLRDTSLHFLEKLSLELFCWRQNHVCDSRHNK